MKITTSRFARQACMTMLACLLLVIAGCGSMVQTEKISTEKYPPTDPAKIEIFESAPPKAFVEIGTLTVMDLPEAERKTAELQLQQSAAKLGADAVLIENVLHYAGKDGMMRKIDIHAIAIKFK